MLKLNPNSAYDPTRLNGKIYDGGDTVCVKVPKAFYGEFSYRKSIRYSNEKSEWFYDKAEICAEAITDLIWAVDACGKVNWLIDEKLCLKLNSILHGSKFEQEENKKLEIKKELEELKSNYTSDIRFDAFLKREPFKHQKIGIQFLDYIGGNGMIADDMGLGKSLQSIGYAAMKGHKTIIVCPASLKYNLKNEVEINTYKKAYILSGAAPKDNSDFDFYILNYEQLKKYEPWITANKWDCVIADESQYLKNAAAQRTKLFLKIFAKFKSRILLTGTAIKNRPVEFYTQLKFLKPSIFKNKMDYAVRYCDAKRTSFGWDFSGASNLQELNEKVAPFYLRRNKKTVFTDMPSKIVSRVNFEMTKEEALQYQDILDGVKSDSASDLSIENSAVRLIKLKQFCSKSKIDRVVDFVKEGLIADPERKIVVFSQFVDTQRELKNRFGASAVSLMGEDSAEKRNEAVNRFQEDPNIKVFVVSTFAGCVGLNLTAGDMVVFADTVWDPSTQMQAEDRCHRMGQTKTVNVYYLNFKDSIEEVISAVVYNKKKVLEVVLGK